MTCGKTLRRKRSSFVGVESFLWCSNGYHMLVIISVAYTEANISCIGMRMLLDLS